MNNKKFLSLILLSLIIQRVYCDEEVDLTFPDDFLIGVGSSAYQIEGAWNQAGKGVSIWDDFTHNHPEKILDHSNADVACDSYHKFKEDVQLLKNLGSNHYRFSLSWPRIFPNGYTNDINEKGVRYYHDLLDELEKYNITPTVTLYHFDLPARLQKEGGWLNERIAYAFADYARFVFEEFGGRIKYFSTINELGIMCWLGYAGPYHAPGVNITTSQYICGHNALKAHALAYRIYDREFRHKQNGLVGIVELASNYYSKYGNDTEAENIAFQFSTGWAFHPILSNNGNYPEIMINRINERSKKQGLKRSRLPTFSKEWIEYIKGTADFIGVNYYKSDIVERLPLNKQLEWPDDSGLKHSFDPNWPQTEIPRFPVDPKGLGHVLRKIKLEYNNPPVHILENGFAIPGGLNDTQRVGFIYSHLKEMLIAMKRDNCNVKMYSYWSLMDSFEWANGYKVHFGLAQVDFNGKNLTRTLKNSARWFASVTKTRKLLPVDN